MPVCPLQCGMCCDYWQDVFPDPTIPPGDCPHMGDEGCDLPREKRPVECIEHLCEVARGLIDGSLTRRRARSLKRRGFDIVPERA